MANVPGWEVSIPGRTSKVRDLPVFPWRKNCLLVLYLSAMPDRSLQILQKILWCVFHRHPWGTSSLMDQRTTYPLSFLRGPQNQPPTRPPGPLTRRSPKPGWRVSVNPSAKSSKTNCKAGYPGSQSVRTSETSTNSRAAITVFAGLSNAWDRGQGDRTGRYLHLTALLKTQTGGQKSPIYWNTMMAIG